MNDGVILNEATHEYTRRGEYVPGVSHLLRSAGLIDTDWFAPDAAERGRMVHLAAEYIATDDLERGSVDPRITGYVAAIDTFYREMQFVSESPEKKVYHTIYNYAGRVDDFGTMPIRRVSTRVCIDYKTGAPQEWQRWQLALYVGAEEQAQGDIAMPRVLVHLQNDGDYRLKIFTDRSDFRTALYKTKILQ